MYVFMFPIYLIGLIMIIYFYSNWQERVEKEFRSDMDLQWKELQSNEKDCRDICLLKKCSYPSSCPDEIIK